MMETVKVDPVRDDELCAITSEEITAKYVPDTVETLGQIHETGDDIVQQSLEVINTEDQDISCMADKLGALQEEECVDIDNAASNKSSELSLENDETNTSLTLNDQCCAKERKEKPLANNPAMEAVNKQQDKIEQYFDHLSSFVRKGNYNNYQYVQDVQMKLTKCLQEQLKAMVDIPDVESVDKEKHDNAVMQNNAITTMQSNARSSDGKPPTCEADNKPLKEVETGHSQKKQEDEVEEGEGFTRCRLLWISNLHKTVTEARLKSYLEKRCGKLEVCEIQLNVFSLCKEARVKFQTLDGEERFLFSNTRFFLGCDREFHVRYEGEVCTTLHFRCIPPLSPYEKKKPKALVKEHFSKFGNVKQQYILRRDPPDEGYVQVRFRTEAEERESAVLENEHVINGSKLTTVEIVRESELHRAWFGDRLVKGKDGLLTSNTESTNEREDSAGHSSDVDLKHEANLDNSDVSTQGGGRICVPFCVGTCRYEPSCKCKHVMFCAFTDYYKNKIKKRKGDISTSFLAEGIPSKLAKRNNQWTNNGRDDTTLHTGTRLLLLTNLHEMLNKKLLRNQLRKKFGGLEICNIVRDDRFNRIGEAKIKFRNKESENKLLANGYSFNNKKVIINVISSIPHKQWEPNYFYGKFS